MRLACLFAAFCAAYVAHSGRRHPVVHRHPHIQSIQLTSLGNVPGCKDPGPDPVPFMKLYRAQLIRIVVWKDQSNAEHQLLCAAKLRSSGYLVNVCIVWQKSWSMAQILDYFKQQIMLYAPYTWAFSIGNEESRHDVTPQKYSQVWKAVLPLLKRYAPDSFHVAGEVAPWSLHWLKDALKAGLPDSQAISAHTYANPYWHSNLPSQYLALARKWHKQLWITEGLRVGEPHGYGVVGPGPWPGGKYGQEWTRPRPQLKGALVVTAWLSDVLA
jgi:hypothetical protein